MKLCLVGADTGCKTRLVRKHVFDNFDDRYITTLGAKVSKKEVRLDSGPSNLRVRVDLFVWDIMESKAFRELLRDAYFYGAKGVVAVSDMTRRQTLEDLDDWISAVEDVAGPVPIAIIGANHDRKNQLEVSEEDVARLARMHEAACFFASEDAGEGVEQAFRYLADRALNSALSKSQQALD